MVLKSRFLPVVYRVMRTPVVWKSYSVGSLMEWNGVPGCLSLYRGGGAEGGGFRAVPVRGNVPGQPGDIPGPPGIFPPETTGTFP